MNKQINIPDSEISDETTESPVVNPDPIAGSVPVDESLIHEAPMDGIIVGVDPMDETIVHESPMGSNSIDTNVGSLVALIDREDSEHFRTRWNEIQGKFVDEPRSAVQQADALVSEVIGQITQMFASEHTSLESQWKEGNDVDTEDLRKALQHYRSFFNRLVLKNEE